jgi:hypothetical protein
VTLFVLLLQAERKHSFRNKVLDVRNVQGIIITSPFIYGRARNNKRIPYFPTAP